MWHLNITKLNTCFRFNFVKVNTILTVIIKPFVFIQIYTRTVPGVKKKKMNLGPQENKYWQFCLRQLINISTFDSHLKSFPAWAKATSTITTLQQSDQTSNIILFSGCASVCIVEETCAVVVLQRKHGSQPFNIAYNKAHQPYSVLLSPGAAVGHAVLNTAHAGLLVTDIHHTDTAQAAAKCHTHRLLMHNHSYKPNQEIKTTVWLYFYLTTFLCLSSFVLLLLCFY